MAYPSVVHWALRYDPPDAVSIACDPGYVWIDIISTTLASKRVVTCRKCLAKIGHD